MEQQRNVKINDPELQAMERINRILQALPDERSRARVVAWLVDKLDFPLVDEQGG